MFKVHNLLDIPDDWKSHRILVWIYWFCHWFFVNFEGVRHHCWCPKFILHDLEKPIRISILGWTYQKVKEDHKRRLHHPTLEKVKVMKESDWCEALSDWEAAYWTKSDSPLNAGQTYLAYYEWAKEWVEPLLRKYNFTKKSFPYYKVVAEYGGESSVSQIIREVELPEDHGDVWVPDSEQKYYECVTYIRKAS